MKLSVCIPTYNRPVQIGTLLNNLLEQRRLADEVVIVDSSPSDATERVVGGFKDRFPALIYQHSEKGLTLQRNRAIDLATGDIVAFLDDDVLLESGFLRAAERVFAEDVEGRVGGVTGVQTNHLPSRPGLGWRLKRKLGIVETDEPGRLLACGETTPLPRPKDGEIIRTEFLPGGLTVWRRSVLEQFRFSLFFQGYGLGEDKYFSACAGKVYTLYVSGDIRAQHLHVAGNRPDYVRWGYFNVFNHCFIMRECSSGRCRWLRFGLFHLIDAGNDLLAWPFRKMPMRTLQYGLGRIAGLIRCLCRPPVMVDSDPARRNRAMLMSLTGGQS